MKFQCLNWVKQKKKKKKHSPHFTDSLFQFSLASKNSIKSWSWFVVWKCLPDISTCLILWLQKKKKNFNHLETEDSSSKFLRWSLMIFTIKGFRIIVFIFIISTTFQTTCPLTFFRCLSNSRSYTEHRTKSFIESTGVACSDSVSHNRVQVLSIPVLLLIVTWNHLNCV